MGARLSRAWSLVAEPLPFFGGFRHQESHGGPERGEALPDKRLTNELVRAGIDDGPKRRAVLYFFHIGGKPAMPTNPLPHGLLIVGHDICGALIAKHLDSEGRGLVIIGHVKAEACPRGHANPTKGDNTQHQGAGGVADAINDHAFAMIAEGGIFDLVSIDQPPMIRSNTVLGGCSQIPQHHWHPQPKREATHLPSSPQSDG